MFQGFFILKQSSKISTDGTSLFVLNPDADGCVFTGKLFFFLFVSDVVSSVTFSPNQAECFANIMIVFFFFLFLLEQFMAKC